MEKTKEKISIKKSLRKGIEDGIDRNKELIKKIYEDLDESQAEYLARLVYLMPASGQDLARKVQKTGSLIIRHRPNECPYCGTIRAKIKNTKPYPRFILRLYKCVNEDCGKLFRTKEAKEERL